MRLMWQRHGKTEVPYTVDDLQSALGALVNSPSFAATFFDNFIRGKEVGNYEVMLGKAGFLLRLANPGRATLGSAQWRFDTGSAVLAAGTLVGSPLYDAGLDRGAQVESIDGQPVTSSADLDRIIGNKRPGDRLSITFEQRGQRRTSTLVLQEDPTVEVVTYEAAGLEVTPDMRRFRSAWLDGRGEP